MQEVPTFWLGEVTLPQVSPPLVVLHIPPEMLPAIIMFSSSTSAATALVRPPWLYGPIEVHSYWPLCSGKAEVRFWAYANSFFLIPSGILPVAGSANRLTSQVCLASALLMPSGKLNPVLFLLVFVNGFISATATITTVRIDAEIIPFFMPL